MANSTYISLKDTAVLVRKALKAKFPATKFSVRGKHYSGGANLSVGWTDGPSEREVSAVTSAFVAGRFNSMIDMAYSAYHWMLPDGSVIHAGNSSDGMDAGTINGATPPVPGATLVHFASDYVHTHRDVTFGHVKRATARVLASRGEAGPTARLTADDLVTPTMGGGWMFTSVARDLDAEDANHGHHYSRHFTSEVHSAIAGLNADTGLRYTRRF